MKYQIGFIVAALTVAFIVGGSAWNYGFDPRLVGPLTASMVAVMVSLWSTKKSEEMTHKSIESSQQAVQEALKNSLKEKVYEQEYKVYSEISKAAKVHIHAIFLMSLMEDYIKSKDTAEKIREGKNSLADKMMTIKKFTVKTIYTSKEIAELADRYFSLALEIYKSKSDQVSLDKIENWRDEWKSLHGNLRKAIQKKLNIEVFSRENEFFFELARHEQNKKWFEEEIKKRHKEQAQ